MQVNLQIEVQFVEHCSNTANVPAGSTLCQQKKPQAYIWLKQHEREREPRREREREEGGRGREGGRRESTYNLCSHTPTPYMHIGQIWHYWLMSCNWFVGSSSLVYFIMMMTHCGKLPSMETLVARQLLTNTPWHTHTHKYTLILLLIVSWGLPNFIEQQENPAIYSVHLCSYIHMYLYWLNVLYVCASQNYMYWCLSL